jgi:ATP/maltotriose-dependent transcriptional regulator MalT
MRVCSGTRRFSSPACSSRTQHRHGGPRRLKARAAAAAIDGFLSNAEEKLQNNNRIGALREWDKALKEENLTQQQRKVLLYNQVNVYAQMGDVELAQVRHSIPCSMQQQSLACTATQRIYVGDIVTCHAYGPP